MAAIAKRLATASARTIVAEVKPLFLGEMSISYLSAAPINVSHKYTTQSKFQMKIGKLYGSYEEII